MLDDGTVVYDAPEPGERTELINPHEIAAMARRPQSHRPEHDDEHRTYVRMLVGSVLVLVVFVMIVGGFVLADRHRSQQLAQYRAQCEQAMGTLDEKREAYTQLREGDAAQAGEISDVQVADTATIRLLDEQLAADAPERITCEVADAAQYDARLQMIADHGEWFETHTASLRSAVDGVTASKLSKDLADKREAFGASMREVQTTLDLTRGNVADAATWDDLSRLLETAKQVQSGDDMDRMTAMESELRAAMDRVNASRDQKIADDERKAAEAKARHEADRAKQEAQKAKQEEQKRAEQKKD